MPGRSAGHRSSRRSRPRLLLVGVHHDGDFVRREDARLLHEVPDDPLEEGHPDGVGVRLGPAHVGHGQDVSVTLATVVPTAPADILHDHGRDAREGVNLAGEHSGFEVGPADSGQGQRVLGSLDLGLRRLAGGVFRLLQVDADLHGWVPSGGAGLVPATR